MDSHWLQMQFALYPDRTKADLAKALGLEPPAVSKILNGTRQIKAQEYAVMRRFFGLPVDGQAATAPRLNSSGDLAVATDLSDRAEGLDIEGWGAAGAPSKDAPRRVRLFIVRETTMAPEFKLGESVLVDLEDCLPSPAGVFLISDGFGQMIRRCSVVPRSQPPEVSISAHAKNFLSQTLLLSDIKILGRVFARVHMLDK